MAHDPIQDHIFGDPDEAHHTPAPVAPRRVPFAGMFGVCEGTRDLDVHPLPRRGDAAPHWI